MSHKGASVLTGAVGADDGPASAGDTRLWDAVDRLLGRATLEGIVAHKVGPLEARRRRALGEPLPQALQAVERAASLASQAAAPLLRRIRASCEGPLLLLKGPEVARYYPGKARQFSDVDILTPDAEAVHRALLDAGFVIAPGEDEFDYAEHHHEPPVKWPTIWLRVEVHARPNWPMTATAPTVDLLLDAARPAAIGIEGISAPDPVHHALLLAAHAWRDEPLQTLRDLIDVAVVATELDEQELLRAARAFGLERVWRTTSDAAQALFFDARTTFPLRSWARHLGSVRERTVFESHLERLLHAFWEVPARAALVRAVRVLADDVTPSAGETWSDTLRRVSRAARRPGASVTRPGIDRLPSRNDDRRDP
jgi:hypothetical protein